MCVCLCFRYCVKVIRLVNTFIWLLILRYEYASFVGCVDEKASIFMITRKVAIDAI